MTDKVTDPLSVVVRNENVCLVSSYPTYKNCDMEFLCDNYQNHHCYLDSADWKFLRLRRYFAQPDLQKL